MELSRAPYGEEESVRIAVHLRRAVEGDAPQIAAVLQASFEEYRPLYTPEAFAATALSPDGVLKRMREGPVWLTTLDDSPVGTASVVVTTEGCYIRGMAVTPAARGLGLARRLLEAIERFALEQGTQRLYLSTTPFLDAAIALYERYGFVRAGHGPTELFGTPLFTMTKLLKPA